MNELSSKINKSSNRAIDDKIDLDSEPLSVQLGRLQNQRYQENTIQRKRLAYWVQIIVTVWLLIVIIFLSINNNYLHLSDNVLMVLLGTTTLNVLGLPLVVLRGFFSPGADGEGT